MLDNVTYNTFSAHFSASFACCFSHFPVSPVFSGQVMTNQATVAVTGGDAAAVFDG